MALYVLLGFRKGSNSMYLVYVEASQRLRSMQESDNICFRAVIADSCALLLSYICSICRGTTGRLM